MKSLENNYVKILFEIQKDDGSVELESVWSKPMGEGYKIDNIPFYARGIAYEDVVEASTDADGALRFNRLILASGHSTVRLWVADEQNVRKIRDELRQMGCSSELDIERLVAVDVPPSISYDEIKKHLDQQERNGIFEYEEACLGQEQRYPDTGMK